MAREYKEICDRCGAENTPEVQPSEWLQPLYTRGHEYDLCPTCRGEVATLRNKQAKERDALVDKHYRQLEEFMHGVQEGHPKT